MLEKTKYFLCVLSIAFSIGAASVVHAQTFTRLFGADGFVIDSRATPYRAITLYTPTTLTSSYSLAFPNTPPPGPSSMLVSDANGIMQWTAGGAASLPPLPPNNIWVGNALSVATPYAPTVPGAILALNGSSTPTWTTTIPSNTTLSVSQLTTGTLQPTVVFNVGTGSTINLTGGTNTSNNVVGAGPGNFAGKLAIPQNAITLAIPYTPIQAGASITLSIVDPGPAGVNIYVQSITPGTGLTVVFSAAYPTSTGQVSYHIINP